MTVWQSGMRGVHGRSVSRFTKGGPRLIGDDARGCGIAETTARIAGHFGSDGYHRLEVALKPLRRRPITTTMRIRNQRSIDPWPR